MRNIKSFNEKYSTPTRVNEAYGVGYWAQLDNAAKALETAKNLLDGVSYFYDDQLRAEVVEFNKALDTMVFDLRKEIAGKR